MERKNRKSKIELVSNQSSEVSSITSISIKRSNNDENIDLNEKHQKLFNNFKYLDVELDLNKNNDDSFDEDHFNFEKNSQNYLRKAFCISKEEKSIWEERFKEMLIEEKLISYKEEFNNYVNTKCLKKEKNKENDEIQNSAKERYYSFHMINDDTRESDIPEKTIYITKFLIGMNLIFRTSYIFNYNQQLGLNKIFFTIYNIINTII